MKKFKKINIKSYLRRDGTKVRAHTRNIRLKRRIYKQNEPQNYLVSIKGKSPEWISKFQLEALRNQRIKVDVLSTDEIFG